MLTVANYLSEGVADAMVRVVNQMRESRKLPRLLTRHYFPIQKALLNPAGVTTARENIDMHRKHATIFIYRDASDDRLETCCSSHVENIWTSPLHLHYTSSPLPLRKLIVQAPRLPHFCIDFVYSRKPVSLK